MTPSANPGSCRRYAPAVWLGLALTVCLGLSYGLRFGLMEDVHWVGACLEGPSRWQCQLRAGLGLMIHFQLLAYSAFTVALLAYFLKNPAGRYLAAFGLCLAIPSLVLYTATLAAFAIVISALRLVRK